MNNAITRPVGWIADSIDRNTRRTVNGLRLLSGLDRPRTGCTPHLAVWREERPSLRRYRAGADSGRPPVPAGRRCCSCPA